MELEILERFRPLVHFKSLREDKDFAKYYQRRGDAEESELGVGTAASEVFEVVDVKYPQYRYAVKVQPKVNPEDREEDAQKRLNRLLTEFLIPTRILPKHSNIVKIKDVLVSNDKFYLVQELCPRDLNLEDFSTDCDEQSARRIFKQIVNAVHFMHQYGVVHCDLNEGNILFADDDCMECKIIDFGVSKYKPHLAKKLYNNFNPRDWFFDEETYEKEDIQVHDISYLGIILFKMMQKANPPYLDFRLPKPDYSTCLPRMKPFHETAHDLLRHIGPHPYRTRMEDEVLPPIEYILQHHWLVGNPHPVYTFRNIGPMFASLRRTLIVLRDILKDEAIKLKPSGGGFRLKLLNEKSSRTLGSGEPPKSDFDIFYRIRGFLARGPATGDTRLLLRAESKYRLENTQYVVKFLFRQSTANDHEAVRQTFKIYNELLIQLRILPRHDHIVNIRNVFVDKDSVFVVREFIGMHTLRDFLPLATNDSARKVFMQIAETVRFMHLFGVVHMDLNCDNIVFTDGSYSNSQIVDFGKAFYVPELAGFQYKNFQEQQWITPQLSHMASESNAHAKVDIKALGEILLAMMRKNGEPLAPWPDALELLSMIGPKPYGPFGPSLGSPNSVLRAPDLGDRARPTIKTLTMDQICNHKWCQGPRSQN